MKKGKKKKTKDKAKSADIKYYVGLSCVLGVVLIAVAVGMFLYLRQEALSYREQYAAELSQGMEDAKNVCYNTLQDIGADETVLANINVKYANAMSEEDILQQYYLVDGMIDYSLSQLYYIISLKNQKVALEGGQWNNYDEEIETLIDTQADLKVIKEQISSIDLDNYY